MLHSASLTDPTLAFSPYNPYASPPLSTPETLLPNGGHPSNQNPLSPTASSAAVAALTAAVAVSAGIPPNVKDSRWLTLEVCRQYQRNQCSRDENECKFAHPPTHVDVQNGRVVCCYDSIKGKCQRRDPPCKYLHPPQHLREQLMQNGRNNMIIRNMQLQLFQQQLLAQSTGMFPFGSAPCCNSVSSNSLNGTSSPNSMLYAAPGPLPMGNPNTQAFLSMGFSPYLSALTNSNLNGNFQELIASETNPCKLRPDSSKQQYLARTRAANDAKLDGTGQENVMAESMKELNGGGGAPTTVIRTTTNNMNPAAAAAAAATLYALQAGPQGTTAVLSQPPQTLGAASLAAMVNANGTLAPAGPFQALPEHTTYFHPTYHIEIPPYPYQ